MGRELAAQRERLKAAEQIAAWQDVARALAHELRIPLTGMKLALARLSRGDTPPDTTRLTESVALLQEEVERLMRMTRSVSDFARLPAPRFQPVALRPLLADVCDGGSGIASVLEGPALTRGLFSTKPGGSGLGLPIAQKVAHEHGGTLRLEPAPGCGTLALVELPLAPPPGGEARPSH